jgi:drug/metabolite transporter (DMT)-like permease
VNSSSTAETRPGERTLRRDHVTLGIVFMLGATVMFAVSSALSKWLVASYSIGEVLFVRTGISLLVVAAFILPKTGLAVYRTNRLGAHLSRLSAQAAAQICLIIAFSMMPLAAGVAINFSAPVFATLAAAVFLHERVGGARWAALIIGFAGVLTVAAPGTDTFQLGALFALGNAMLYGTVTVAVRGLTATESTETLLMYQHTVLLVIFAALLPLGLRLPDTSFDAGLMLAIGVSNALAQYWWTRSLHLAPASAVTPFYYFMLVWSIGLGFLVWGDVPTASLLIGSAIVCASGLYLLWRESKKPAVAEAA